MMLNKLECYGAFYSLIEKLSEVEPDENRDYHDV